LYRIVSTINQFKIDSIDIGLNKKCRTRTTGCFKKVAPLKLFGIFSLRLSLFAWNFASWQFISACQFLYIYLKIYLKISSNGVIFSMITHRFHRVKFWVLNADASWARAWWESHHFQLYPDKGWKLRKSAFESTTLGH